MFWFWLFVLVVFVGIPLAISIHDNAEANKARERANAARKIYENRLLEFEQDCNAMSHELGNLGKVREEKVFRRIIQENTTPIKHVWSNIPSLPDITTMLERASQEVKRADKEREELKEREAKEATWRQLRYEFEKLKTTRQFKQWVREQWECQLGQCAWCEKPIMMWPNRGVVVDHVKPLSYRAEEQGDNSYDNLVLSCYECNDRKGDEEGYCIPSWIVSSTNKFSPAGKKELRRIAKQEKAEREATLHILSKYCSQSTKQSIAKRYNTSNTSKAIEKELASVPNNPDIRIDVTERSKGEIAVHEHGGEIFTRNTSERAFTETFFPDYEEVRRSSGETPGARGLGTHTVYDRIFLRSRDSPHQSVQLLFQTGVVTDCGEIDYDLLETIWALGDGSHKQ